MKKINFALLLFVFLVFVISAKAQEQQNVTYKIIENGSVKNIQPYIDALNTANFKYHRLRSKRTTITFDTGLKVELFSATELAAAGKNVNPADYPESFPAKREEPLFKLGPNNFILEEHTSTGKHH